MLTKRASLGRSADEIRLSMSYGQKKSNRPISKDLQGDQEAVDVFSAEVWASAGRLSFCYEVTGQGAIVPVPDQVPGS